MLTSIIITNAKDISLGGHGSFEIYPHFSFTLYNGRKGNRKNTSDFLAS